VGAEVALVALAAFAAATIAGVSGFGGAVVLLPVLVAAFGARDAIVVLTVAQLLGNGSRVYFNRDEVDPLVVHRFALGAVPLALVGGVVFATLPAGALTRALGAFMLAAVAWRRLRPRPATGFPPERFTVLGAAFGFLSAIVGRVGPVMGAVLPRLRTRQGRVHRDGSRMHGRHARHEAVAYGGGVLGRSACVRVLPTSWSNAPSSMSCRSSPG